VFFHLLIVPVVREARVVRPRAWDRGQDRST
jgi:hypothetical protein